MDINKLEPSSASTTRESLEQIAQLVLQHGIIVGLIHQIDAQSNHSTRIFYADGFSSIQFGLGAGYAGTGPHGLLTVIHQIYGWHGATINDVAQLNQEKLANDEIDYPIFKINSNDSFGAKLSECPGSIALEQFIEHLASTPHAKLEEI